MGVFYKMVPIQPILIVLGGLPGTGKTSLAKELSNFLRAVYVRVDTIEQALLRVDALKIGNEGYLVAYEIAADNLRAGNIVIADSVNPLPITRDAWRNIALENKAALIEIEIICSDANEHRRCVESRQADIQGHKMPTWQEVLDREYHDWETKNLTVDTSGITIQEALKNLLLQLKLV